MSKSQELYKQLEEISETIKSQMDDYNKIEKQLSESNIEKRHYSENLSAYNKRLEEINKRTSQLNERIKKAEEEIHICKGYIFDDVIEKLKRKYGENRVHRIKVIGEAQDLTEIAYLDELRNLGYEPLEERENKRAKSFFHMMQWLKKNPHMLKYAKTGWPRLQRYKLFRS